MPERRKTALWVLAVYALSFICYVPLLMRQYGAMVPGVLLHARYLFILVPALISGIFLAGEGAVKACWSGSFKKISAAEIMICIAAALIGVLTTCGYSFWWKAGPFSYAYPSILSFAASAVYLFATALMEELAWRGFLLKRIAAGGKKPLAAGLTGVIWAIWHIPMWTIRNSLGPAEVIPLLIWAILISFILGMVYFRFENLLSVSLLHMTFNICFSAPTKYNIIVVLISFIICYIFIKFKKGIKEF